jgi:hypothetical protein
MSWGQPIFLGCNGHVSFGQNVLPGRRRIGNPRRHIVGEASKVGKFRSQEASSSRRNSPQRGVGTWK